MALTLSTSDSAKLEPKRKNRWIVSFEEIPTTSTTAATKRNNILSFCAHSGTRPEITFEMVEVQRLNEKWKFAGKPGWNELSFSFYDYISSDGKDSAFTILRDWWTSIYNPLTGSMGYAIEYKTNSTVAMLDPAGVVASTWHVFYMWPKTVHSGGDVNYDSNDIAEVGVTFVYDYAIAGTESGLGSSKRGPNGEIYPTFL